MTEPRHLDYDGLTNLRYFVSFAVNTGKPRQKKRSQGHHIFTKGYYRWPMGTQG